MPSQVSVFHPIVGEPEALRHAFSGDPVWLPGARAGEDQRWELEVTWGRLRRQVWARIGEPWSANTTLWRTLSWDPVGGAGTRSPRVMERLLPAFDGELGLHLQTSGSSLVLDGRYQPPGGEVGAVMDELAFHRVARTTLQRLLASIAEALAPVVDVPSPSTPQH